MPGSIARLALSVVALGLLSACASEAGAPRTSEATSTVAVASWPQFATVPQDRERYTPIESNPVTKVAERPVSTFSVDVDTADTETMKGGNTPTLVDNHPGAPAAPRRFMASGPVLASGPIPGPS